MHQIGISQKTAIFSVFAPLKTNQQQATMISKIFMISALLAVGNCVVYEYPPYPQYVLNAQRPGQITGAFPQQQQQQLQQLPQQQLQQLPQQQLQQLPQQQLQQQQLPQQPGQVQLPPQQQQPQPQQPQATSTQRPIQFQPQAPQPIRPIYRPVYQNVYPQGVALAPVAAHPVATYPVASLTPVAHPVATVPLPVYADSHPHYQFQYGVSDPLTGDIKNQEESRDGDVVKGQYSLVQPDGITRVVSYTADNTGFHAQVTYSGVAPHPQKVPVTPVAVAAPVATPVAVVKPVLPTLQAIHGLPQKVLTPLYH